MNIADVAAIVIPLCVMWLRLETRLTRLQDDLKEIREREKALRQVVKSLSKSLGGPELID